MRQKDSADFAMLLTKIDILKTRIISTDIINPDYPLHLPHIFLSNSKLDDYNSLMYDIAPASGRKEVRAVDVVLGDVSSNVKKQVRAAIPKKTTKTMGRSAIFQSAIGLLKEVSCNFDVFDGLANGAGCVLKQLEMLHLMKNVHLCLKMPLLAEKVERKT